MYESQLCKKCVPSHRTRTAVHNEGRHRGVTESQWPASWLTKRAADTFQFGPSTDCRATEVELYYNSLSSHNPSAPTPTLCVRSSACAHVRVHVFRKTDGCFIKYKIPESVVLYVVFVCHHFLSAKHVTCATAWKKLLLLFQAVAGMWMREMYHILSD